MGIAEELWKSTMVSFPDELPATVGGYILVYKKKQESDNFVSKVRFRIRLCEVLISFLRVYSVIFFFVGNFQELIVVRLFDLHTSETNILKSESLLHQTTPRSFGFSKILTHLFQLFVKY